MAGTWRCSQTLWRGRLPFPSVTSPHAQVGASLHSTRNADAERVSHARARDEQQEARTGSQRAATTEQRSDVLGLAALRKSSGQLQRLKATRLRLTAVAREAGN